MMVFRFLDIMIVLINKFIQRGEIGLYVHLSILINHFGRRIYLFKLPMESPLQE